MVIAPRPSNDRERLNALWGYELLDTQPEEAFDVLTKLAAGLCGVPIAIVSLIDEHRQWFKSQVGLGGVTSTSRDVSFCAHAILQTNIFEVRDATIDRRFVDNPLVAGDPHIRFYAGMPLVDEDHMVLGTLCVIDRRPRTLSERQREQFAHLGRAIVGLIAARIRRSELNEYRLAKEYRSSLTKGATDSRNIPLMTAAR